MWRQKKLAWTTFTCELKSISEDLPQVFLSLDSSNFPYVCFCGFKSSDFRFLTDKVTRVRRIFFLLYLTSNHILIFIYKHVGSHLTSFWILMEFEKKDFIIDSRSCFILAQNFTKIMKTITIRDILYNSQTQTTEESRQENFSFSLFSCCFGCLRIDTMRHVGLMWCVSAWSRSMQKLVSRASTMKCRYDEQRKYQIYSNLLQLFHLTQWIELKPRALLFCTT